MSKPNDAVESVSHAATRYAQSATALSDTIVKLEKFLNELPAKREASACVGNPNNHASISFRRRKDGSWGLYYEPPLTTQLSEVMFGGHKGITPLRDAPIDAKISVAPLLSELLNAMSADMMQRAVVAESATQQVTSLLTQLSGKGGK